MSARPPLDPPVLALIDEYCHGNGLDVCCGWRRIAGAVGIDTVPFGEMTNADENDPHISQADWCGDVRELPVKSDSMDFVFSHHGLEHIGKQDVVDGDTVKALTEWTRVLKPGGCLVLVTPDINHCVSPIARHQGRIVPHGLEPEEVKPLLRGLPLEVLRFNRLGDKNVFEIVAKKTPVDGLK